MANVPNGVETLPKILIGWVRCTNVTDDRQTERQTDDRRIEGWPETGRYGWTPWHSCSLYQTVHFFIWSKTSFAFHKIYMLSA